MPSKCSQFPNFWLGWPKVYRYSSLNIPLVCLGKSSSPGSVNQQLGYIAFVVWNLFENKRKGWSADGQWIIHPASALSNGCRRSETGKCSGQSCWLRWGLDDWAAGQCESPMWFATPFVLFTLCPLEIPTTSEHSPAVLVLNSSFWGHCFKWPKGSVEWEIHTPKTIEIGFTHFSFSICSFSPINYFIIFFIHWFICSFIVSIDLLILWFNALIVIFFGSYFILFVHPFVHSFIDTLFVC